MKWNISATLKDVFRETEKHKMLIPLEFWQNRLLSSLFYKVQIPFGGRRYYYFDRKLFIVVIEEGLQINILCGGKNIIMFHIDHQIVIQQWYGHLTQGDHKVSTFMRTRDMIFVYANFLIILEKSHKIII